SFLLLSGAVAIRVLLSFPTRRSSDLLLLGLLVCACPRSCGSVCGSVEYAGALLLCAWCPNRLCVVLAYLLFRLLGLVCLAYKIRDRKSTRLNSSHVKISYAVCCLKNK